MNLEELKSISKIAALLSEETITNIKAQSGQMGKNIVILQRGWVIVGDLAKEGEYFVSQNTSVIRKWGTSRGLGQLAKGARAG